MKTSECRTGTLYGKFRLPDLRGTGSRIEETKGSPRLRCYGWLAWARGTAP